MRPLYETAGSVAAERALAAAVADRWNVRAVRLKTAYPVDYAFMRDASTVAFAEIKCRRYPMAALDSMGGFMLSLHKWAAIKMLCAASGLPFVVIVSDGDGAVWAHRPDDFAHDGIAYSGRTDRGDAQDVEPVVLLRSARFYNVKIKQEAEA